ncbi:hypothetical protein [Streptomyces sp. NPDC004230]
MMVMKPHPCLIVLCDVCEKPLTDFEFDAPVHFAAADEAIKLARHYRWSVVLRDQFVCPERDADHQAFLDALLPPEPVSQIPGQLGLDGTEAE